MEHKKTALELKNVSRTIDDRPVLKDVTWRIKKGEHWAMLGPNGAGKSTLMKIISGYLWPTKGEVKVLGQKFGRVDLRELRKKIGYVNSVLLSEIPSNDSVLEVVISGMFGSLGLYNDTTERERARAENTLEIMDCLNLRNRKFGNLSQGEKQKVMISRALVSRPGILILDEPAIGLDPAAREGFLKSVEKTSMMKKSPTLIYITHHIEEIMPLFEKVIVMKDGKIVAKGKKEDILTDQILTKAFGTKMRVVESEDRYILK